MDWADVAAAWPGRELPSSERAIWDGLDEERRSAAALRVAAMLGYERQGDWRLWADVLGLSKPGFFTLRKRWTDRRSLTSLVPHQRAHSGRAAGHRLDPAVRKTIEVVVGEHGDWPRLRIAREVRRRLVDPPAESTLRPLIDQARAAARREAVGGDAAFGGVVVITACPVSIRSNDEESGSARAYGGFAIDVATGRVLGSAADVSPIGAIREAARAAAGRVDRAKAAAAPAIAPRVELHLSGTAGEQMGEMRRLIGTSLADAVFQSDGPGMGIKAYQMLGQRVGVVDLRPRAEVRGETVGEAEARRAEGRLSPSDAVGARLAAELAEREAAMGPEPVLSVNAALLRRSLLEAADV